MVCGAAVVSTRERRRSKGMCGGVPEETPGIEPRDSASVVGENASVVRGSVQANSAGVARRIAPADAGA